MRLWVGVLGVAASALVGCSSSSDGGSSLVGLWRRTHATGTGSCTGDYDSDAAPNETPYRMRLRPARGGYLEYLTLDQLEPEQERVTCVQKFSITGSTAAILADQDCKGKSTHVNPASGTATTEEITQIFSEDQLALTGDTLHEVGQLEYETSAGPCHGTFSVDYTRVSEK